MDDPIGPSTQLLSTGEIISRTGLTRQQIYSYLNAGLIHEADRTAAGRLRFDPGVIERIELIRQLNASGYALRDIRETFRTAFHPDG